MKKREFLRLKKMIKKYICTSLQEVIQFGMPITILVDSGATHSFVDPKIVKQVRLEIQEHSVLEVSVANGERMYCNQVCRKLRWFMQGHQFEYDLRVLKLGGCDMILGGD